MIFSDIIVDRLNVNNQENPKDKTVNTGFKNIGNSIGGLEGDFLITYWRYDCNG